MTSTPKSFMLASIRSYHLLPEASLHSSMLPFRSLFSQLSRSAIFQTARINHPAFSTTNRIMAQEYKLKDITSLNLTDGQMQEAELEGLEGGKVLLMNSLGKMHATSSNCTHYGAPLKNGVLSSDGRLTCPWHGTLAGMIPR